MTQDWWVGDTGVRDVEDPHKLNILPRPTPPSPDKIPIRIELGVTSRVRLQETFKRTVTYTSPFIYTSDLFNYQTLVPTIATTVWTYVQSEKVNGAIVEVHFAVWLDNVTHPWVGAGVVRLAKGHIDGQLSNEELTSAQVISDVIEGSILNIKNIAKY